MPTHTGNVASVEAYLRTDPTDKTNFPSSTYRGLDPTRPIAIWEDWQWPQATGPVIYDAARRPTDGWTMQRGTDRMALSLIHNYSWGSSGCSGGCGNQPNGCYEVDDRFFLNLQVGRPDFAISNCS